MFKRLILFSAIILLILGGCNTKASTSYEIRDVFIYHADLTMKEIEECYSSFDKCEYENVLLEMKSYVDFSSTVLEMTHDEEKLFNDVWNAQQTLSDIYLKRQIDKLDDLDEQIGIVRDIIGIIE